MASPPRSATGSGGRLLRGLEAVSEALAQLGQLGRNDRYAIGVRFPFTGPIVLMIILRRVPVGERFDRRYHLPAMVLVGAHDRRLGGVTLAIVQGEDGAAI